MRVLHCVPSMVGGGAERQLAYLAEGQVRCGVDVHVALARGGENVARLERSGATIHWLKDWHFYDPRMTMQLRTLMLRIKPDLVQSWLEPMDIPVGRTCKRFHLPWVLCERNRGPVGVGIKGRLRNAWRASVARHVSGVVANSFDGVNCWLRLLGGDTPHCVIHNAIPFEEISQVDASGPEAMRGSDRKVIVCAGRFDPQKNWFKTLEALEAVLVRMDACAYLCGEGQQKASVQAAIDKRGLSDRIQLPGYVPDLWGWLKRADVFVNVAVYEGQPNVVLEAMACGTPLVVSDIPAHREILDTKTASIVSPDASQQVAEAIVDVLTNTDAARQRADKACEIAQEYSLETVTRAYMDFYAKLISV